MLLLLPRLPTAADAPQCCCCSRGCPTLPLLLPRLPHAVLLSDSAVQPAVPPVPLRPAAAAQCCPMLCYGVTPLCPQNRSPPASRTSAACTDSCPDPRAWPCSAMLSALTKAGGQLPTDLSRFGRLPQSIVAVWEPLAAPGEAAAPAAAPSSSTASGSRGRSGGGSARAAAAMVAAAVAPCVSEQAGAKAEAEAEAEEGETTFDDGGSGGDGGNGVSDEGEILGAGTGRRQQGVNGGG
eukprot:340233-Chlamydomonas_euryale.AAC.1